MSMLIKVRLQFEGWHHWPGAPDKHAYLRNSHRHMFHVEASKTVGHSNRQIEIVEFKSEIWAYCMVHLTGHQSRPTIYSCEEMADMIACQFDLFNCSVMEDNENGAVWVRDNRELQIPVVKTMSGSATNSQNIKKSKPAPTRRFVKKMFWGTEAEGPHRGTRTLFVPGDVTAIEIQVYLNTINNRFKWDHCNLYLGADNFRVLTPNLFDNMERWMNDFFSYCFIEINSRLNVPYKRIRSLKNISFVWAEEMTEAPGWCDFIKIVTNTEIVWTVNAEHDETITQTWRTPINDPLFLQDKEV